MDENCNEMGEGGRCGFREVSVFSTAGGAIEAIFTYTDLCLVHGSKSIRLSELTLAQFLLIKLVKVVHKSRLSVLNHYLVTERKQEMNSTYMWAYSGEIVRITIDARTWSSEQIQGKEDNRDKIQVHGGSALVSP